MGWTEQAVAVKQALDDLEFSKAVFTTKDRQMAVVPTPYGLFISTKSKASVFPGDCVTLTWPEAAQLRDYLKANL